MSTSNNRLRHPIALHRRTKVVLPLSTRPRLLVERSERSCHVMKVRKPRVSQAEPAWDPIVERPRKRTRAA